MNSWGFLLFGGGFLTYIFYIYIFLIYTYIHISLWIHRDICTKYKKDIYLRKKFYTYIHIYLCIYIYIYPHIFQYIFIYIGVYMYIFLSICIYTYIHTYTHISMYIYIIRYDSPKLEFPCQVRLLNSYYPHGQHAEILHPGCRCKSDESQTGE